GAIDTPAVTSVGWTLNVRFAAAAGDTMNALLVAAGALPAVAASCWLPARFTLRLLNVATPPASLGVTPPPVSVPPPTSASDTAAPGTLLPNVSFTSTCTATDIVTPATTSAGWAVNDSALAAAGVTSNAAVVTVGSAPLEAVSCLLPTRSTLRPLKLAMPLALLTTAAPPVSVPLPTSASATEVPGTALSNASETRTWTAGAIATPATTSEGCAVIASDAAGAGDTANAALDAVGSAPLDAVRCLL